MRIAVATLVVGDEYSRAVQLATQSKIDYCRIHGYDSVICLTSDSSRPPPWSKIPLLQAVLPEYDFIFFSDADTLVTEYGRRIEDVFVEPLGLDKHISLAMDPYGYMNTGNFLLRNNVWASGLLKRIWELDQFTLHDLWEQQAFAHLFKTEYGVSQRTAVLPNDTCRLISYPNHPSGANPESFLTHLSLVRDIGELERLVRLHYKPPPVVTSSP